MLCYDVPSFEVRGQFQVNQREQARVKSLCDLGNHELFAVGTESGEITVWRWVAQPTTMGLAAVPPAQMGLAPPPQPEQPAIHPFTGQPMGQPAGQPGGVPGMMM